MLVIMKQTTIKDYRRRVLRVLAHLDGNPDEPVTVAALADVAGFSPYHFHRAFRSIVGQSIGEYVRALRLDRAARRLARSDASVTDVAFASGYLSAEAFSRAFSARFGQSPSTFRSFGAVPPILSAQSDLRISVERLDPVRVAYIRQVGSFDNIQALYDRLYAWADGIGLDTTGVRAIGASSDDITAAAAEAVRYDACIECPDGATPGDGVSMQALPGGVYAVTRYRGPYDRIGEMFWRLLFEWLPRTEYAFEKRPCLELYYPSPGRVPPTVHLCLPIRQ